MSAPIQSESTPALRGWLSLWIAWSVAFVVVGAFGLRQLGHRTRVADQSPLNSADAVFRTMLGLEDASHRFAECLAEVPENEPVAIISRGAVQTQLPVLVLSTQCWPRPVHHILLQSGEAFDPERLRAVQATRAIFFLGVRQPTGSAGIRSLSESVHFYRSPNLAH